MKFPPAVPQDKANHFLYGSVISAVVAGAVAFKYPAWSGHAGLVAAAAAAALKEWVDYEENKDLERHDLEPTHGVEVLDWVYTTAGGLVAAVPYYLLKAMS